MAKKKKKTHFRMEVVYTYTQLLRGMKQENCLSPGVQGQPKRSDTPPQKKKKIITMIGQSSVSELHFKTYLVLKDAHQKNTGTQNILTYNIKNYKTGNSSRKGVKKKQIPNNIVREQLNSPRKNESETISELQLPFW